MSYTEIIINNISAVRESYKTVESIETGINKFLDHILYYQRSIETLCTDVNKLTSLLVDGLNKIPINEFSGVEKGLDDICLQLTHFYISIRKSKYYSSIKSHVITLHYSISNLKEAIDDFHTFRLELEDDQEYKKLVNQINAI